MRVVVVKLTVLSALVAAVVAQAATSQALNAATVASGATPRPAATLPPASSPTSPVVGDDLVAPVPAAWSFDDAHGGVSLALAQVSATAQPRHAAPRKPPRPPSRARSGALPAPGTPQAVLAAAYVAAAAKAPAGCHLEPAHLAAIGQVESGSVGGRQVDGDHRVTPAIYGPLLDGGPFAVVHDTDHGAIDGSSDFDRAVGPLQFLPGTWRWAGRDGDGDGRKDPQNVFDAALATADYLCRDGRDLTRPGDLRGAILTYNWSGEYVAAVTQWVTFFTAHGLAALDDVAFRVGSGGRASDLAVPESAKAKEAKAAAEKAKADKIKADKAKADKIKADKAKADKGKHTGTPSPGTSPTGPATTTPPPGPTGGPTTPAPTVTTPPPGPSTTTPVPDPTTPAPDPTTPSPTGSEPAAPVPTDTGSPDDASTPSKG